MGFFETLSDKETAVLLHRSTQDGTPTSVTVPFDFSVADVEACLRSFGYTAKLGEAVSYEEPELGRYVTVPLLEVREYTPAQTIKERIAHGTQKLVKQQLAGFGDRLKKWADKL